MWTIVDQRSYCTLCAVRFRSTLSTKASCVIDSHSKERVNPLPDMPILGSFISVANRHDVKNVKNMDKWGYNYLIE